MTDFIASFPPVVQALLGTGFTWFVTALGAATVFLMKDMRRGTLDFMLGFAAGVMIAASYWSLLAPSIEMAEAAGGVAWFPPAVGFLLGGFFLRLLDRVMPHLHPGYPSSEAEGPKTSWRSTTLLVLAITIHNFPEGLAVGVAFGAAANLAGPEQTAQIGAAIALAIGIGLQNFPEGLAVSMPLRREGLSRARAFWYGQLSGMCEPVAGLLGALSVLFFAPLLPYAMAFAAGAMIYVVVEEVIPMAEREGNVHLTTIGVMIGFTLMMVLDVGLG